MSPLCPLHDPLLPVDVTQLVRPCGALDMRVSLGLWPVGCVACCMPGAVVLLKMQVKG